MTERTAFFITCLTSLMMLLSLNVFAAVGVSAGNSNRSQAVIRWVMEEAPPFAYHDHTHGEIMGFFPEMTQAICREMKVSCEFSVSSWERAINAVRDGHAEGMLGLTYAEERANWLSYSAPIIKTTYGFFALPQKNAPLYKRVIDLEGKDWIVGTQGPSDTYYDLEQLQDEVSDLSIKYYPLLIEAIFAVHNGDINAVFGSLDVIRAVEAQAHMPPLHDVGIHQTMFYYYAWNKTAMSPEHAAAFNKAYETLRQNGKISAIAQRYHVTLAQ